MRKVIIGLLFFSMSYSLEANDVKILSADFKSKGKKLWSVHVTLKHGDAGWKHYVDAWRVVDSKGNVLGERVLQHPHVNEQPFTRSLRKLKISKQLDVVFIEAHDKKHGWSPNRMKVDLRLVSNGYLKITSK